MKEVGILQSVFKTAALSQDKGRILQEPVIIFVLLSIIFSTHRKKIITYL